MKLRRRRGGLTLTLSPEEAAVVASLADQTAQLLAPEEGSEQDPLARLVNMTGSPVERPRDLALARLLPDAYGDDPEAAGEFRRLMEHELRETKCAALRGLVDDLAPIGTEDALVRLGSEDHVELWLQALNDIRLTIGARLELTADTLEHMTEIDPGDPRLPLLVAYDFLTHLQQSLLEAVD